MKETLGENIMESVHKTRVRDSEQVKTAFALYKQDTAQKGDLASCTRLITWLRSIWKGSKTYHRGQKKADLTLFSGELILAISN